MAGSFEPGQQEVFDRYYTRFVFAQWSLPENRAELWRFRGNLRSNLRTAGTGSRPPQVHDHLNSLALKALEFLARPHPGEDEFHPATRVNAMLMIGEFNAAEAGRAMYSPPP